MTKSRYLDSVRPSVTEFEYWNNINFIEETDRLVIHQHARTRQKTQIMIAEMFVSCNLKQIFYEASELRSVWVWKTFDVLTKSDRWAHMCWMMSFEDDENVTDEYVEIRLLGDKWIWDWMRTWRLDETCGRAYSNLQIRWYWCRTRKLRVTWRCFWDFGVVLWQVLSTTRQDAEEEYRRVVQMELEIDRLIYVWLEKYVFREIQHY